MISTKYVSFMFLSILAIVLVSGLASADVLTLTPITIPTQVSTNAGSFTATYNVSYIGAFNTTDVNFFGTPSSTVTMSNGATATISIPTIQNLANNTGVIATATITFPSAPANTKINVTVRADPTVSGNTQERSFEVTLVTSSLSLSTPSTIYMGKNGTLTLTNTGTTVLTNVLLTTLSTSSAFNLQFAPTSISSIAANGGTATSTITPTNFESLKFGRYTATIKARDDAQGIDSTMSVNFAKSFCSAGPVGTNLTISNIDTSSTGDDDNEWKALDTISIDVEVENVGDDTVRDVYVELALFDSAGRNVRGNLDFLNTDEEKVKIGTINDGNKEKASFEFKVPGDLDAGNYRMAVKAYSKKDGEANLCIDNSDEFDNEFYQTISVIREDKDERAIVVDEIKLPTEMACGETAIGSFKVFNIGTSDQDQIKITMVNADLGLNQEFEIREDLKEGESKELNFAFQVPSTARNNNYPINFRTYSDYRSGSYRQSSEDTFTSPLKVIGCGTTSSGTGSGNKASVIDITASLASEAKPSQPLVVRSTVKNTGSESVTLRVDATDYQSWADLDDISQRSITLAPGQSKNVEFTFNVKDSATGTESFTIETQGPNTLDTQDVEVVIQKTSTGSSFSLGGNSNLLWIIGLINVVLIALIIVVAVRLSHR